MWMSIIEFFELAIFLAGQSLGGSVAWGVFAVSTATRLLVLPLTYHIAKRARRRQAKLAKLKPQLEAVKARWADDPLRLMEETRAVYVSNGLSLFDSASLKLAAVQTPIVLALFQAVRRVVSGSSLAAVSIPITLVASSLAAASVLTGNNTVTGAALAAFVVIAAVGAGVLTLTLGHGFGFYSAAFQGVSVVQGLLLRRLDRRMLAATGT